LSIDQAKISSSSLDETEALSHLPEAMFNEKFMEWRKHVESQVWSQFRGYFIHLNFTTFQYPGEFNQPIKRIYFKQPIKRIHFRQAAHGWLGILERIVLGCIGVQGVSLVD